MSSDQGYRLPPEIISYAVWLYHRFNLSHRDIEDLLAERGVTVSYETIRLCVSSLVLNMRADSNDDIVVMVTTFISMRFS